MKYIYIYLDQDYHNTSEIQKPKVCHYNNIGSLNKSENGLHKFDKCLTMYCSSGSVLHPGGHKSSIS